MRQASLRQTIEDILRAEVTKRGISAAQLAKRAGIGERTAQRFMAGKPVGWNALERTRVAMRVDVLDCDCRSEGKDGAGRSRTGQPDQPVVGWEQVARVLRVSRWTLRRKRQLYDSKREAWFPNEAAVHFWYDGLVSGGEQAKGKGRRR